MFLENPRLILIIEDEIPARSVLTATLIHAGYRVLQAPTGCRGLGEFAMHEPDAIVLDLELPDVKGTEIVRQVRERSSVPILALAGGDHPGEDAAAVDAGADVVLPRRFEVGDVLSRLRKMLRARTGDGCQAQESPFTVGDLSVDLAAQRVSVGGRAIHLSPPEFLLLTTLIHHSGRVVTYRFLLNQIWNSQQFWQVAYLKLLVSSLRHKLERDPVHPRYVMTERGVGYRMATE